ncbi:RHS repeat-associated core domain-containing protein, partial [Chryseobacterium rhizoplanae]
NTYHKRLGSDPEKLIVEKFTYDSQNRLLTHTHQVGSNPVEYLSQNKYNELSQLESKKVGGIAAASPLQAIVYQYNIRGWMTKVNDPASLNGKLFGYEMKYNNPVYTNTSSGRFNGNIAEIDWNISSAEGLKRYNYQYDALNRMLKGAYSQPNSSLAQNDYFNEELSYDLNGNIKTLKRFSWPAAGGTTAEKIDDLIYNYQNGDKSNVLDKITLPPGVINNSSGYNALQGTMVYNSNGNMTDHPDRKMKIIYNYLNLPNYISVNEGLIGISNTSYTYRADGTKVSKTYSMNGSIETNYLDGFQYDNRHAYDTSASLYTIPILKFVPTSEGYYDFTENKYIYNYTDHLGNIRVSYRSNGSGGVEIIDANNYYPFGLKHQESPIVPAPFGGVPYNYKYNGKELQETGMYDYGARFYMPDMGRWGVVDPLAEKSTRFSPYSYTLNNPIRFIDPDGRSEQDWVQRTGQSGWEYRSDITSAQQASDAGYIGYANGRGDDNSKYTTPMSSNGIDTGVDREVVLGEGGNYTVDGEAFISKDQAPYVSSQEADKLGKALASILYVPGHIMSGGTSIWGKGLLSVGQQVTSSQDVNLFGVAGDMIAGNGIGEILGGTNEFSVKKFITNDPTYFRTAFDGSMSVKEAASTTAINLLSTGFGKLNGITKTGATGLDAKVVDANSFLIGVTAYKVSEINAGNIQNQQKRK